MTRLTIKFATKKRLLKTLVSALEFLAFGLFLYLIVLPFLPNLVYQLKGQTSADQAKLQDLAAVSDEAQAMINHLPANQNADNLNRVIIPKIGVNSPIVESADASYALNRGAWRTPESSTPDKGGNTVLSGHRFKYLPPNNLTFYLLDKLAAGDVVSVIWQGQDYIYKVNQTKIVEPTDLSVLAPTAVPTLTLYTCDPIYSQQHRLVVIAELVK